MSETIQPNIRLDDYDYAIMQEIQENCKKTGEAISESLKEKGFLISPGTCLNRIKKLEKLGIIEKNMAIVDRTKIRVGQIYIMMAKISNRSPENIENFLKLACSNPRILEVHSVLGDVDFILKAIAPSTSAVETISQSFGIYASISSIPVATSYKEHTPIVSFNGG